MYWSKNDLGYVNIHYLLESCIVVTMLHTKATNQRPSTITTLFFTLMDLMSIGLLTTRHYAIPLTCIVSTSIFIIISIVHNHVNEFLIVEALNHLIDPIFFLLLSYWSWISCCERTGGNSCQMVPWCNCMI